jgi:hypothetical protein
MTLDLEVNEVEVEVKGLTSLASVTEATAGQQECEGIIVTTNDSNEAPLSVAESFEQALATITVSASNLPALGEGGQAIVDISKFTIMKILNKRSGPSGVEYKCELEPLWLAAG